MRFLIRTQQTDFNHTCNDYDYFEEVKTDTEFQQLLADLRKTANFHRKHTRPMPSISITGVDCEYFEQFI